MKRSLYYFSLKELIRSAYLTKSIASTAVIVFLGLYFAASFLFLAFNIDKIMAESHPGLDVFKAFNSIVLIYLGADLVVRFIMQSLPAINFKKFIIYPVKRTRIIRYLLSRSVLNFFNLIPLVFLVPFTFDVVVHDLSPFSVLAWFTGICLLVLSNHFLSVYLKWRFHDSQSGFYVAIGLIAALFAVDFFEIVNLNEQFGVFLDKIAIHPQLVLILSVLPIAFYALNYSFLKNNLYLDSFASQKGDTRVRDFAFLNKLGDYGKFISLEMKMIWRNKRPKNAFIMSVFFLLYGFIIYKNPGENKPIPDFMLFFGGIFMTGLFTLSYGQFFPAWHSRYFSFLMSQNIKMKEFLQAVYLLLTTITGVYFLVSLGYAFLTPRVIWFHLVVSLYNIGVNIYFILLMGLYSSRPIDLDKSAFFNYQGMGAQQFLVVFPMIFAPIALFFLLKLGFGVVAALVIIGLIGLAGILLQPLLINRFAIAYLNKKHKLISNYKKG